MEFPILQFVSPIPATSTEANGRVVEGFADLIEALLDSLVGSDEADVPEQQPELESDDDTDETDEGAPALFATTPPSATPAAPFLISQQTSPESNAAEALPEIQAGSPLAAPVTVDHIEETQSAKEPTLAVVEDVVISEGVATTPPTAEGEAVDTASHSFGSVDAVTRRPATPPPTSTDPDMPEELNTAAVEEVTDAEPVDRARPVSPPMEPSRPEAARSQSSSAVEAPAGESGGVADVDLPDLGFVVDRIEEWMERTGGSEPTTIALELPDPDGDLLVRVGLRDGRLELNVVRPGGEAPTWLVDQLDEALARHGFEMAGDRHRREDTGEAPERPTPARPRHRPHVDSSDGLLI